MHRIGIVLFIITLLSGCMSTSYERVSNNLTGTVMLDIAYGINNTWVPIGKEFDYILSGEESENLIKAKNECIFSLNKENPNPPNSSLSAIQFLRCMESKSWYLVLEEIVITR